MNEFLLHETTNHTLIYRSLPGTDEEQKNDEQKTVQSGVREISGFID